MSKVYDSIVAGAGIWGCTMARRLAEAGKNVLVLEKRAAIGGNCRCEIDAETGIEVHKYGSHIFHTSNEDVWQFVRRFSEFNGYRHCVLAKTKLHTYHLPIGCTLLKEFFGRDVKPSEMTEQESREIFDVFIRGYTSKQWGVPPEKVDSSIIARLKVRDNYSTDYFDDKYQGISSDGYNKMFERMLDHPNITVQCNCELCLDAGQVKVKGEGEQWINSHFSTSASHLSLYYSGPIDELFDYKLGALPWRTLRFEQETLPIADYQGNSVVNYPDIDVPWTRIHEFKHYHPEWVRSRSLESKSKNGSETVIMREYSEAWQLGDEPYYPINTPESAELLARYQKEVEKLNHRSSTSTRNLDLIIGGRLGQYRYFDMDKAIEAALQVDIG